MTLYVLSSLAYNELSSEDPNDKLLYLEASWIR